MRCPDRADEEQTQLAAKRADEYDAWIAAYNARNYGPLGMCRRAVDEMTMAFSELTAVPGHVFPGRQGHWWCVDAAGNIVDPTRSQFAGEITYEAWTPGTAIRCGKCRHCGEEIWAPVQVISYDAYRNVCDDCGGAR